MRNRPFIAARVEKRLNRWVERLLRRIGWRDSVVPYTGYGNLQRMRVLARVVLLPKGSILANPPREDAWAARRGWRNLYRQPTVNRAVVIRIGDTITHAITTSGGYVDISVSNHGLAAGWHHVSIMTDDALPTQAPVLIIGDDTQFGIISDIDDTVLSSHLPRPLTAAYNAVVATESTRMPVAGMAQMYRAILRDHPGAPMIYVSTGAWNTQPFLERFLARHGFPPGPMLLTDWGPTNTGWFRSGAVHKMRSLESIAREFPQITWLLVGDDGQRDPGLYAQFAHRHPDNVAAIAIRELDSVEHLLTHGILDSAGEGRPSITAGSQVRAPDGHTLLPLVRDALNLP